MGFVFIFDTQSQHTFSAPQSVIYNSDLTGGPYYGFYANLNAVGSAVTDSTPVQAITGIVSISPTQTTTVKGILTGVQGQVVHSSACTLNADVFGTVGSFIGSGTGIRAKMSAIFGGITITNGVGKDIYGGNFQLSITGNYLQNANEAINGVKSAALLNTVGAVTPARFALYGAGTFSAIGGAVPAVMAIFDGGANPPTAPATCPALYGLYLPNIQNAVLNYAIYTNLGWSRIGDQLLVDGGLNYKRSTVSNADKVIVARDVAVVQTGTMTASRTWTLPAVSSVPPGHVVMCIDESGTVTGVNTIVITRAGADTINGGTTATISSAYGVVRLISDGTSKWTIL